eukprot:Pompholyxophrys_punicea_v1_NODE_1425_length_725_cov_4.549254.p1 type:complete len:100 gc:universal NODE_1425_length_725_cov_4.549254:340-41(-)
MTIHWSKFQPCFNKFVQSWVTLNDRFSDCSSCGECQTLAGTSQLCLHQANVTHLSSTDYVITSVLKNEKALGVKYPGHFRLKSTSNSFTAIPLSNRLQS